MRRLLPVLIALAGLAGGLGAGIALRPAGPAESGQAPAAPHVGEAETGHATGAEGEDTPGAAGPEASGGFEFVKLNNQFVVPVVKDTRVSALVVMSLNLEVPAGESAGIYALEPKLRDRFLQVLFDHANSGGFDGAFTAGPRMNALRVALLETARAIIGRKVRDVLITDIMRQDA